MPRKIPTKLKILRGERSGRINKLEPIAPAARVDEPPEYLKGLALQRWHELFPLLSQVAVITASDTEALGRLCELYRQWREVRDFLEINGLTYPIINDKGETKYIAARPEVSIHKTLVQQMRQLEQDFGLSPTSRAGLKVAQPHEADPLDEFLAPARMK